MPAITRSPAPRGAAIEASLSEAKKAFGSAMLKGGAVRELGLVELKLFRHLSFFRTHETPGRFRC